MQSRRGSLCEGRVEVVEAGSDRAEGVLEIADAGSLDEQALMVGGDLARYGSERGRDATGEGGRDVHTTFLICLSTSSMP